MTVEGKSYLLDQQAKRIWKDKLCNINKCLLRQPGEDTDSVDLPHAWLSRAKVTRKWGNARKDASFLLQQFLTVSSQILSQVPSQYNDIKIEQFQGNILHSVMSHLRLACVLFRWSHSITISISATGPILRTCISIRTSMGGPVIEHQDKQVKCQNIHIQEPPNYRDYDFGLSIESRQKWREHLPQKEVKDTHLQSRVEGGCRIQEVVCPIDPWYSWVRGQSWESEGCFLYIFLVYHYSYKKHGDQKDVYVIIDRRTDSGMITYVPFIRTM